MAINVLTVMLERSTALIRPLDFNAGAKNLFAPAGLDIGSEAPEEIALSITSEIAAVLSDRRGGFLRERNSDIHATIAATDEAAAWFKSAFLDVWE